MTDEDWSITVIVEDTGKMAEQMPVIEMTMALALAKKRGVETVDMKLERNSCEECTLYQVPHQHLIGTIR